MGKHDARRPNIKDGVGFKIGEKHDARVNINGYEAPKFVKEGEKPQKKEKSKAPASQQRAPGGQVRT